MIEYDKISIGIIQYQLINSKNKNFIILIIINVMR